MIKSSFYTMVLKNGKKQAELVVDGYSDGSYYYYKKDSGFWCVIHPLCGLSIANGNTRKEARENAYSKRIQDSLDNMYKNNTAYYKRIGAEFDAAVLELKRKNREAAGND